MKTNIPSLILVSMLTGFAFLHTAHAVSPPPDGGYPGLNTAEGQNAFFSLTSGTGNTAVGWYSLKTNAIGNLNTGVGAGTLLLNTSHDNTAVGAAALLFNSGGNSNTAVGAQSLINNTTGNDNVGCGYIALQQNTDGVGNTAVGFGALASNIGGSSNVAVGFAALSGSTGDSNVGIGTFAGDDVTTATNVICIGQDVFGANVNDSCYIGNIWAQPGGSQAVFVDATGKLGAQVSSRRFKKEIKQMENASEALFALTPVSFRYKKEIDPTGKAQFGLVAEDVAKVNPDLVIPDKEGKPYTVRYDQINAMLLNEFIKEHKAFMEEKRTVQEQDARLTKQEALIANQQEQIEAITAGLQKVSAQLEVSKAAPQTVLNR